MDTDLELLWPLCSALMVLTAGVLPMPGLPALLIMLGLACHSWLWCDAAVSSAIISALMVSAAGVLPMLGKPMLPGLPAAGLACHAMPSGDAPEMPAATDAVCDSAGSCCICSGVGRLQSPLMVFAAGVLPMPGLAAMPGKLTGGLCCGMLPLSGSGVPLDTAGILKQSSVACCGCTGGGSQGEPCTAEALSAAAGCAEKAAAVLAPEPWSLTGLG